jgi:hypothetical protein
MGQRVVTESMSVKRNNKSTASNAWKKKAVDYELKYDVEAQRGQVEGSNVAEARALLSN